MAEMINVERVEEEQKFILLTDLEGNENCLISKYAEHSLAPKAGLRGLQWRNTSILEDENGEKIEIYDRVTYSNLDLGVGKKLEITYATVLDKGFYRIMGQEFLKKNGLVVDFDKKTVTFPGNKEKTVTGKDLPPGVAPKMYPPNGVIILIRGEIVEEDEEDNEHEASMAAMEAMKAPAAPATEPVPSTTQEEKPEGTSSLTRPLVFDFHTKENQKN